MNIRPPELEESWDSNDTQSQAELLAYGEIRNYEDQMQINSALEFLGKILCPSARA